MSIISNIWRDEYRLRYKIKSSLNPFVWKREIRYRNQRINRGWSERDAWGGGEHIAEVSAGILRELGDEKNIVDWDWYFRENQWETLGYKNLNEVAQDIENYLYWQEHELDDEIYKRFDIDTRFAIEFQLYEDYKNGMRFVAENIGALWW